MGSGVRPDRGTIGFAPAARGGTVAVTVAEALLTGWTILALLIALVWYMVARKR